MDVGFTARVEEELDEIAAGERAWVPVLQEFYGPFNEAVTLAIENAERVPRSALDEETDVVCRKVRAADGHQERQVRPASCRAAGSPSAGTPSRSSTRQESRARSAAATWSSGGAERATGRSTAARTTRNATLPSAASRCRSPVPECSKLLIASGRNRAQCTSCDYRGAVPEAEEAEAAV